MTKSVISIVLLAVLTGTTALAEQRPPWASELWEPISDTERQSPTLAEIDQAGVPVKTSDGINYMTGGLGSAERAWMDKHGDAYTWKMVFSKGARGGFVSGVVVTVLDEYDREVFKTTTDGPWLLVDLPAGAYQAQAEYRDQVKRFSARLNDQQQVSNVNFE